MDKKRELKQAYKQEYETNPPPAGVYQVRNSVTGKIMIGTSMNLIGSKNSHPTRLLFAGNHNRELQEDLALYGPETFIFEVLEALDVKDIRPEDRRDAVLKLEEKWLDRLQPYGDRGYNKPKRKR